LCGISSAIAEPGVIRQVSPFDFVTLGELSGEVSPRARAVEQAFRQASRTVKLSTDIRLDIWHKFLFLASSAGVCAVTRQTGGPVRSDPDTRAMLADAIAEIAAVGRRSGVALEEDALERMLAQIDGMPDAMKPSMALDLERGNRLELEALNGTVVRLGQQFGVPTPVNRFIYAALKLHKDGRG
jgi:2-dehydropantoate 2-reductase